jgi:hypothetical protein
MRDSDNNDIRRLGSVDYAERKAAYQDAAESVRDGGAQVGVLANGINGVLHVVEKVAADPATEAS